MGRMEILRNIIDNSEHQSLKTLISFSKMLQQKVFMGFRPQTLTKQIIIQRLLRPAYVNDDEIYEFFCNWWRNINKELLEELTIEKDRKWEHLINQWSSSKVRLAIILSDNEEKDGLLKEFSEKAAKIITNGQDRIAGKKNAAKNLNAREIIKLNSKVEKLEKRLKEVGKKNKSLAEENKTLKSGIINERNKLEKMVGSNKELNEKVKSLHKTNQDLSRQIGLLKREAASRLTDLKVVQIDYTHLGGNLEERKHSLSLFYDLLCSLEGMNVDIEKRPIRWLENANIKVFWKREGNKVIVLRRPADHLITNIGVLLEDFLNDKGYRN